MRPGIDYPTQDYRYRHVKRELYECVRYCLLYFWRMWWRPWLLFPLRFLCNIALRMRYGWHRQPSNFADFEHKVEK